MNIFYSILFGILGYLLGSLNPAYLISKYIYHIDLKTHGSGNLGGTNAARVMGKKIGIIVIILDISKAFIAVMLASIINKDAAIIAGGLAIIGHCYPFYLHFKGGKGVASYVGYLLALSIFIKVDFIFIFITPILIFLLVLGLSRMVSLASMCLSASACLISLMIGSNAFIILLILTALIIFKHLDNIKRIIAKQEAKITWIK
ncbi:MAG: glycerol-3-phosphate 1-O-acyltransferase PlsY [Erysipelotrichaceae bacterium]|nr:glycerol-3-phosphate 1-O-acyltransferase PlsY [Erysipelotrichaceae bacterium]